MLTAGLIAAAWVVGIWIGAESVSLSARDRVAGAVRARDRAITAMEDAQAEAAHWRDLASSPVSALLIGVRGARS